MHTDVRTAPTDGLNSQNCSEALPIKEIVIDVYESSEPGAKRRMLNLLVGRAYDVAPPGIRKSLLEQLTRPLGVLGMMSVAGGTFARFRFQGHRHNDTLHLDDLNAVRNSDVIALVDHVQQVSTEALVNAVKMLSLAPALNNSGAVSVLTSLVLKRSNDRIGI